MTPLYDLDRTAISSAQTVDHDRLTPLLRSFAQSQSLAAVSPVSQRPDLLINTANEILVSVRLTAVTPAKLQAVADTGLTVQFTSVAYRLANGFIAPARLAALAALPQVESVEEAYAPRTSGEFALSANQRPAAVNGCAPVVSEGYTQMRGNLARSLKLSTGAAVDGTGVTVGIISDAFDVGYTIRPAIATRASADVLSGDLPGTGNPCGYTTPVTVLRELPLTLSVSPVDQARALAQVVHDMAPGAKLIVASGLGAGLGLDMAQVIRDMRTAGADIIVDDVAFQDQSFFQDDVVGAAVNEVVADGAVYLTTAGNSNRILVKNDIAKDVTSYTALSYRPAPCPALTWGGQPVTLTGDCHDFNPSASVTDTTLSYTIGVGQGFYTRLQWGEPWYGVTTDMNFYWVDATGAIQPNPFDPAQQSAGTNDNLTTQKPLELEVPLANQSSTPSTYSLVINRAKGSGTPPLWAYFNAGIGVLIDAEYYTPTNPGDSVDLFGLTSFGHRASASAISVAAVPYDNGSKPQDYSTRGEADPFLCADLRHGCGCASGTPCLYGKARCCRNRRWGEYLLWARTQLAYQRHGELALLWYLGGGSPRGGCGGPNPPTGQGCWHHHAPE